MFELFQPDTQIFFAYTGVDDYNKTVHDTIPQFWSFAMSRRKGEIMQSCSFQRVAQGYEIRVPKDAIEYELLFECDTVCIFNGASGFYQQWVGIIDRIEWKNPGCYFVYFHIDWYTSTLGMVDYENTYAYIEREHVEKDWNGNNPEFMNMGVDEGFSTAPDTPVNCETIDFTFDQKKVLIFSPYDESGKPNFTGDMEKGIYSSMFQHVMTPSEANDYLTKIAESETADLNNIVSICSLPDQFTGSSQETKTYPMPWNKHVSNVRSFNNSKCWSGEFCQIVIMTSTGEKLSLNTQWFGSNQTDFDIDLRYYYYNGDGGCTVTAVNKNQSYNYKAYNDFTITLKGLPHSQWVGNMWAQWKAANMAGFVASNAGRAINTLAQFGTRATAIDAGKNSAMTELSYNVTNTAELLGNLATQAGDIITTIGNARTSGTVVSGMNSVDINTSAVLEKYGFQIVYYLCQNYVMQSVDSFFDRFGYKINRIKKLNRKARPLWSYIKTHEVHFQSNTGISAPAARYIASILNHGVTFWRDPNKIGNYENAEMNKGV